MSEPSAHADPAEPMLRMLNGHCLQQALHVAAVLGLADLLAGEHAKLWGLFRDR